MYRVLCRECREGYRVLSAANTLYSVPVLPSRMLCTETVRNNLFSGKSVVFCTHEAEGERRVETTQGACSIKQQRQLILACCIQM